MVYPWVLSFGLHRYSDIALNCFLQILAPIRDICVIRKPDVCTENVFVILAMMVTAVIAWVCNSTILHFDNYARI
jgi:hypothetical protein